jgi:beta-glucosidase
MNMAQPRPHGHRRRIGVASAAVLGSVSLALTALPATTSVAATAQVPLETRDVPLITEEGLQFRDLDRNGELTPYEDWRLTARERAADLAARMTLAQKAGLLAHGTLATTGSAYNVATNTDLIQTRHMSTFITRLATEPGALAEQSNVIQQLAENTPWGIPVVISTDPRNGFATVEGQTVARVGNTAFPEAIGMAAADDPKLTETYGDIVRQEYRAVGIHEGLSPQADISTEPRWTRVNGTFGADPATAKEQVGAYVRGLQHGADGLEASSVAAVVKHWVGYGAQVNGYDSHYYYGRYASLDATSFRQAIIPFEGAFEAGAAGVMPTYSILKDLVVDGQVVEQVGAGFNRYLVTDLLRGQYDFEGVTVSDWGITGNCPEACRENRPPASFIGPWGVGMPWGMEEATPTQRVGKSIAAGVDQIGGSNDPSLVVAAYDAGLISTSRLNEAARRVLVQKFDLGLFEDPFVDPEVARTTNGSAAFKSVGDAAQAASLTLLTNQAHTLPASTSTVKTVYLRGVGAAAAQARGLTVVDDPAKADLAVVRLADPRGGSDLTDLDFKGSEADYAAFAAAAATGTPTVAVPQLDRPLVLTNVEDRADAVLANYGVTDEVLLQTIFGERAPGGTLPFELSSAMTDVAAQRGDLPNDTARQLHPYGFGLRYPTVALTSPTTSGTAAVGRTLRATAGTWPAGTSAPSYQWLRDGRPISKATSGSYRVRLTDVGSRLSVAVTAARPGYAATTVASTPTRAVPRLATRTTLRAKGLDDRRVRLTVTVGPRSKVQVPLDGTVVLRDGSTVLRKVQVDNGRAVTTLRLRPGRHVLSARYQPQRGTAGSASAKVVVRMR